jgi:L-fucose mutarotase/ribose pyranase (RbsD/FucU family)
MIQYICKALYLAAYLLIATNATAEIYEATPFEPLRTVNVNDVSSLTAALAEAQPGDDIVLADGVYVGQDSARYFGAFSPGASGTFTHPIRIRAANPGNAHLTIRENPNELGPILGIHGESHIIVADLVFDAETTAMRPGDGFVRIEGADHIRFENNIINGALPPDSFVDDNLAGLFIQMVTESRIANNLVQNVYLNGGSHDGEGIIMYNVNTSVIEFNTTQNIGGVGIYLKGDREDWSVHNFGNTIRYNYATSSQKCLMVSGNAEHGGEPLVTRIYQNVVNDCKMGIRLHMNAAHVDVFNNTAVNISSSSDYSGMVSIAGVINDHENRIWGNLVYSVTQENPRWRHSQYYQTESANYTSDYNWQQEGLRSMQNNQAFSNLSESQQAGYELNTVEGTNPFVDFDNGDYRLDATSYTHGSYVPDWSGIFGDYVVPGAYITGNEQIGRDTISSSSTHQYTVLNPRLNSSMVMSLVDNNEITAGNSTLNLDRYELGAFPANSGALSQGVVVTGTGPFELGSSKPATDMPVPASFAGTQFAMPQIRDIHKYYMVSPDSDTNAQISISGTQHQISLPQGVVVEFDAGETNGISSVISADDPILVSHVGEPVSGSTYKDASPMPPASTELWGIRSVSAYVTAVEDDTHVTMYASDGTTASRTLSAGRASWINVGESSAFQGTGSAIRLVADKPISAIQFADGDGSDQTAFFPSSFLGSRFGIPKNTQYIAVACPEEDTHITLYNGDNEPVTRTCSANGNFPGKAYFGSDENNIMGARQGAYLESNKQIFVIYEVAGSQDEHNLLGTRMP